MALGRPVLVAAALLATTCAIPGHAAGSAPVRTATLDYGPWVITTAAGTDLPGTHTITARPQVGETFVSVALADDSGVPEPAYIGQDVDGDGHPDASMPFCGASPWVPIGTPGAPVVVEIAWQSDAVPGCPLLASVGGAATFGFVGARRAG